MKLLKYKDGSEYIVGGINSIEPVVDYNPEEYEIDMTKEELKEFIENKKDKNLRKKLKRIERVGV